MRVHAVLERTVENPQEAAAGARPRIRDRLRHLASTRERAVSWLNGAGGEPGPALWCWAVQAHAVDADLPAAALLFRPDGRPLESLRALVAGHAAPADAPGDGDPAPDWLISAARAAAARPGTLSLGHLQRICRALDRTPDLESHVREAARRGADLPGMIALADKGALCRAYLVRFDPDAAKPSPAAPAPAPTGSAPAGLEPLALDLAARTVALAAALGAPAERLHAVVGAAHAETLRTGPSADAALASCRQALEALPAADPAPTETAGPSMPQDRPDRPAS